MTERVEAKPKPTLRQVEKQVAIEVVAHGKPVGAFIFDDEIHVLDDDEARYLLPEHDLRQDQEGLLARERNLLNLQQGVQDELNEVQSQIRMNRRALNRLFGS